MEKFTASNGVQVWIDGAGNLCSSRAYAVQHTLAAEEFFLARRDAELGRWRWPENPDYMVYRVPDRDDNDGRCVRVIRESNGVSSAFVWERLIGLDDTFSDAVRAYFAAHPARQPWEDAKPGEVWALTTRNVGDEVAARVALVNDVVSFDYISGVMRFPVSDDRVESARRIWPEASA